MRRRPDWDTRLAAWLEGVRLKPFAWGEHDCCCLAAGAVQAMTGVDPIPEFRGRYRSERGAARALLRIGAGTLEATLDGKFARVPAALAQRGDLVMTDGLLSVCLGGCAAAVGREGEREGLVRFDRAEWVDAIAWRVAF